MNYLQNILTTNEDEYIREANNILYEKVESIPPISTQKLEIFIKQQIIKRHRAIELTWQPPKYVPRKHILKITHIINAAFE